jgi:hypothetical protein
MISYLWVYGELDLMFYEKKILYFCVYWKTILFLRLQTNPILVYYDTGYIGKSI